MAIKELVPEGRDQDVHHGARRSSRRLRLEAEVAVISPVEARGFALNASRDGLRVVLHSGDIVGMLTVDTCEVRIETKERVITERARVVWRQEQPDGCILGLQIVSANAQE